MLLQIDLPHYDPLFILSEAILAVELAYQPGQFVEIPMDEDAEVVDPALLAAVMDAEADHGVPALVPAAAAAPTAAGQMREGGPAPAPDVEEPGGPGGEWLDALIARVQNPGEGHPASDMNSEGLPSRAFTPPAFLQASRYAPT
ncbi:hypothetical protein [Comamonas endophytica]|uniref:Uncharacterized protein n=1 Tax=Comamonas endophytica TaxID=2949090 RepID=A0ABY6G9U4_9BURK|nr:MULTISPECIES: hypothetical protein [unclassified Acidovorax]MCD2512042.1 hypothetical protein [Acidovorax sp. D4N7]UYG51822.1 hypothetical protein M9799_00760 [Acidovorax sp. 5MLIR]